VRREDPRYQEGDGKVPLSMLASSSLPVERGNLRGNLSRWGTGPNHRRNDREDENWLFPGALRAGELKGGGEFEGELSKSLTSGGETRYKRFGKGVSRERK